MSARDWRTTSARAWAETVLRVLRTPYPYAAAHVSSGPDDVDVTPELLHPAFHGCLDWHSSVHMQWSAVRLLRLAPDELGDDLRADLVTELDHRLTSEHGSVEATYLRDHPGFERPYGWGWAAMLDAEVACSVLPEAASWSEATAPVHAVVDALVAEWLPRLAYPVRHGEHANTAFGLALLHDAAASLGHVATREAVEDAATRFFAGDRGYPAGWEPGGSDFLSPALCEADLMRRVLPPAALVPWLAAFLPDVAPLLDVPEVRDRTDGKAVHLFGLALSRAWQLRLMAPSMPEASRAAVLAAAEHQVAAVEPEIVHGDFMSTHWLVSFALLAATSGAA